MKQFQLSVFYNNAFLSYQITTEDDIVFRFVLKSAPAAALYAPDDFNVSHQGQRWMFDKELDAAFKKSVVHTLKKANV